MKFITFGVLMINCIGIVLLNSPCILEKNQYNEYPWVIKLYWERTWGHGSLTAPNRVLSAYEPFTRAGKSIAEVVPSIEFIATMRGPDGQVSCTARRKGKLYRENVNRPFVGHWELSQPFEVGYNYPFLFTDKKDLSHSALVKNLKDTTKTETCIVPMFVEEMTALTDLMFDKVKLVEMSDCKSRFPASSGITNDDFCVSQLFRPSKVNDTPLWLGGAVILCRNKPLGLIKESSPPPARGLTLFVSLAPSSKYLETQGWPTKPPGTTKKTTTAAGKATTITAKSTKKPTTTAMTAVPHPSAPTEFSAEPEEEPSTLVTKERTFEKITIEIPEAPTRRRPTTTPTPTGFIGTPPLRAKPANHPPRLGNWVLVGFTVCLVLLQLFHIKYISYI